MIRAGITRAAEVGFLSGVHRDTDRYRMALYGADAKLSPATESYASDGEVSGDGYERGGRDVPGWVVERAEGGARIRFHDVVWEKSTITARGALIYNDSRPGIPAVAVLDFGDTSSTNGRFVVRCPEQGLITWTSEVR